MKKTYTSSKMTWGKKSNSFETLIKRSFRNYVGTLLLTGVGMSGALAQTNPTPQPVPYTQNFDNLTNAYPAGWQGWRLAGQIDTNYLTTPPSAEQVFYASNLTNATNAVHIGNIGQRLGFLNTTNIRTVPVLAVSTLDRQQITIKYDINLQRVNSDRGLGVQLQYRIGTEGNFTAIGESLELFIGNGTGINTSGTDYYETRTKQLSLPAEIAFKENVQFRWVTARTQDGSGDNLGFSIDNIEVNGITDPCANNPLPYTEDFSELTTDVRECTLVENVNNDNETWKVLTANQAGFTAPYLRYKYHGTNAGNDWFFTKGLALEAGVNYRLRYKYGTSTLEEKLKISIGQEQNSSAMNQVIFDHGTFTQNSPNTKEIFFTVPTSGNYYVGFHSYSATNKWYIYLDDIVVDLAPTCLPPSAVTISNITHNTAQASWTAAPTEASSYEYYVSTETAAPTATTTATGTTTTTSATLSNLSQTTNYNLWVRTVCSDTDKSEWTAVTTFRTGQLAATFPFTDNFDGDNNGWDIITNSTATSQLSKFYVNTPTPLTIGTGSTAANLTFANGKLFVSSETDNLSPVYKPNSISYAYRDVVLPADMTTAKVSFKWLMKGEGATFAFDYGRFLIVPMTSTLQTTTALGNTPTALNNIFSFNDNPYLSGDFKHLMSHSTATNSAFNGAYEEKANVFQNNAIDLSAYAGQTVRVLFYFRSDSSSQYAPSLIIDDFVFDYTPSCLAPTQMSAANVTARTADVSWTASTSDVNGYEYYYSTEATAPTEITEASGTTTETTISLANLTPETTYYVWTKTDCTDASKSEWSANPLTFTTTISCPAPTAPTTTNVTTSSATIGWTSTSTDFEYIYSTTNTTPEASATGTLATGTTAEITGLDSSTTYYWWVRAVCGEDDKSSWLGSTFQTTQVPATFPYADNFDTAQWVFANGTQVNKFYIGTPIEGNGVTYADNKLFVSNDGISNTYATNSSYVFAYRDVTLPTDLTLAKITYDWILKGEGTSATPWDHARFFILPSNATPAAGTDLAHNANTTVRINNIDAIYQPGNIVSNHLNTIHHHLMYNPAGSYSGAFEIIKHNFIDEAVDLSAYAGQTVRLVFYFENDTSAYPPSLAIDNFVIDYAPNCLTPTNLATSNVSYNSATINWTGNSDTYNYVITTENTAPTGDAGTTTSENTVNLTELAPSTTYYWWMKSNCDTGDTWYQGPSFTTNATPQAYPFTDDFETLKWNLVNGNETNKFYVGTPTGYDNGKLFISENGNTNTYNVGVTSRAYAYTDVELPADITTAKVKFDVTVAGEENFDFGRFFIVPTSYEPNNSTNITYNGTITGQYFGSTQFSEVDGTTSVNQTVDLSAVAGQTVRLLFYWKNDSSLGDQPPLSIDNFCFANECTELAIGDINKGNFAYYPNPVQNELNFKGEQAIANIEVYNLTGQIVNNVKVGEKTYKLDTTKLTAGVYMVKVTFENGTTKTVKIIKK